MAVPALLQTQMADPSYFQSPISARIPACREPKRHSLKRAVLSATRIQRYKQLLRSLGPQRQFTTLVQQLKRLRTGKPADLDHISDKEVAAPVEEGHRSPVILFMAGGMGAGKSTVR